MPSTLIRLLRRDDRRLEPDGAALLEALRAHRPDVSALQIGRIKSGRLEFLSIAHELPDEVDSATALAALRAIPPAPAPARTVSEALAAAQTPQDRQRVIEAAVLRYAGRLPMPGG